MLSTPVATTVADDAGLSLMPRGGTTPESEPAQGFYWPVPPYALYAAAEPTLEPQACEIEDLKGIVRTGALVAMSPGQRNLLIHAQHSKKTVSLAFSQFRRLALKEPIHPQQTVDASEFAELLTYRAAVDYRLQMADGTEISGVTVGYVETGFGLFVFPPLDDKGVVERVFYPSEAFSSLAFGEHIGKLLVAQNTVTAQQVELAASEQQALRRRKLGNYLIDTEVVSPDQLMIALDQQSKMPLIKLGEALTRLGYIDAEQLDQALERQKNERSVPLGQLLVEMGFLTRHDLNSALARKMGYPMVDLSQFPVDAEALKKIPMATARRLQVMPLLVRPSMIVVAAADPTNRAMLEELGFLVQVRVIPTLGDELQIQKTIESAYVRLGCSPASQAEAVRDPGEKSEVETSSGSELLESMERQEMDKVDVEEAPNIVQSDNTLVRLINTMIIEAHGRGVSDIHIESQPRKAKVRIRFRRDGVLSPYLELPHTYRAALVARLKIMADLDISERRKPQDGKIDFSRFSEHHRLELRIVTVPTANGLEDVVMRLLASTKPIAREKLGLSDDNLIHLRDAVSRPYGMVLCVGPTGSGKTTTLHSILSFLNTPERKIWTAEDPVEITQPELRQVQINPRIDWTFAKALRSFLRADPDIIMVGEIRDTETAKIAVEASLTGHLVLSTLHTNSAAETITRLVDMGMDPFNFADSLLAVLAQRLARRWCRKCRQSEPATPEYLQELIDDYLRAFPVDLRPEKDVLLAQWNASYGQHGGLRRYSAPGCDHCMGVGMSGRLGLHELLRVTPAMRRQIQTGASPVALQTEVFQDGWFRTLRQDGIAKVLAGQTSIEEVRANTNS